MSMNLQQIDRTFDHILDHSNEALNDDVPVRIFLDNEAYREVVAVYPEDSNGRLVIVIKASH